jgi:glucose-6-phosphate isomerase
MTLQQSIDLALAAHVGASGLPQTAVDAALSVVENAAKRLREDDATGRLPLLHMPRTTDDLGDIRTAADELKRNLPTTPCRASAASPSRAFTSSTTSIR